MKATKFFGAIFAVIGIALAAFTIWLSFTFRDATPILISVPEAARDRAQSLMESVCQGNYDAAGKMILGNPQLGVTRIPADPVGQKIWGAFRESFSYELVGECVAIDDGLIQSVRVMYLDMDPITENLGVRSRELMQEQVDAATDMSQIYNENNEFREEFVFRAVETAVEEVLAEYTGRVETEIKLHLVYREGRWWVEYSPELIHAISGGIVQ